MKRFSILAAIVLCSISSAAQTPESRIALTPYVEFSRERIPEVALRSLERKLASMATANGFASVSGEFIITAMTDVLNTSVTATAPPKFVSEVEVAVYVLNNPEQLIVDQKVYSLKGLGTSEQSAVMNAINQLNVRSTDTKRFMENVRTRMLDYYAARLPAIIAKAQSLAAMSRHEEALAALAAVPESLAEYPQVADLMVDIYTGYIDREAKAIIADAKTKIAQHDYAAAFSEKEYYEQQRAQAMKEYEDSVELEKQKIAASREIASKVLSAGLNASEGNNAGTGNSGIGWLYDKI